MKLGAARRKGGRGSLWVNLARVVLAVGQQDHVGAAPRLKMRGRYREPKTEGRPVAEFPDAKRGQPLEEGRVVVGSAGQAARHRYPARRARMNAHRDETNARTAGRARMSRLPLPSRPPPSTG
jgi:hypothetical protein